MDKGNTERKGRTQERLFLGLIAILLITLFVRLFGVLQGRIKDVDQRLKEGTVVNLNAPEPAKAVKALLTSGYYLEDPLDIDIISNSIASQEAKGLSFTNIGDLNKRKFNVVADEAYHNGGAAFKKRVAVSRSLLGFTGDDEARFTQEKNNAPALPAVKNLGMGNGVIKGKVSHKGDALLPEFWSGYLLFFLLIVLTQNRLLLMPVQTVRALMLLINYRKRKLMK
ncbi:hypothetical protein [Pedobacter sp. NJ-S-72]